MVNCWVLFLWKKKSMNHTLFVFFVVLDTSTGVWIDTSNELMRRSLHAAESVGNRIYVYGGLREGNYFWHFFCIYLSIGNFTDFIFFTILFLCRCITRRFTSLWRTFKFWTNSPILFGEVIYLNFLPPFSLCIIWLYKSFFFTLLGSSPETPRPPASEMNDSYKPSFSREKLQDLVNKVWKKQVIYIFTYFMHLLNLLMLGHLNLVKTSNLGTSCR